MHYYHQCSRPPHFIIPTFYSLSFCPPKMSPMFYVIPLNVLNVLQILAGGRKPPFALWWSALAVSVSRCSAPPALCATCPGRLWWCHGSTQTGRTRRVWASSCSATLNPIRRRLHLKLCMLKGDCLCLKTQELVTWHIYISVHHQITWISHRYVCTTIIHRWAWCIWIFLSILRCP